MLSLGPVQTDFDFASPGKRSGFIDLDHSDNAHAFRAIRTPVGVICGGAGPTVLLSLGRAGVVAIVRRNPLVSPGDHLCLLSEELGADDVL